jgi:hypothetical protein
MVWILVKVEGRFRVLTDQKEILFSTIEQRKGENTTTAMRKYLLVVENVKVLLFLSLLTLGHGRQIVVG